MAFSITFSFVLLSLAAALEDGENSNLLKTLEVLDLVSKGEESFPYFVQDREANRDIANGLNYPHSEIDENELKTISEYVWFDNMR